VTTIVPYRPLVGIDATLAPLKRSVTPAPGTTVTTPAPYWSATIVAGTGFATEECGAIVNVTAEASLDRTMAPASPIANVYALSPDGRALIAPELHA
jgi:hypothetical protein